MPKIIAFEARTFTTMYTFRRQNDFDVADDIIDSRIARSKSPDADFTLIARDFGIRVSGVFPSDIALINNELLKAGLRFRRGAQF